MASPTRRHYCGGARLTQRILVTAACVLTIAGIVVLIAMVNSSPGTRPFAPGLLRAARPGASGKRRRAIRHRSLLSWGPVPNGAGGWHRAGPGYT
ncbi:hypothetical protein ABT126_35105 [Streptomyces sp. NPDC002012]|uniref:hypothetical protein n=1 Tax=unclassified Streptomyces TaxID=2593676 RepID=UPI0033191F46